MPARTKRAESLKQERQEDLRLRIKESGMIDDFIDSIGEMEKIRDDMRGDEIVTDPETQEEREIPGNLGESITKLNAIQMVNNQRKVLINKILPDLKHIEMDGELGLKVVEVNRTGVHDDEDDDFEDEDAQSQQG